MFDRRCGCLISGIISIIFGVLIGYLFFAGFLPWITTALWIALGASGISLFVLFLLAVFGRRDVDKCVCINGECWATGLIGTIVLATAALSLTLAIANIGNAILVGLFGGFVVFSVISLAKMLCCLITSDCKCRE